LNFVIKTYWKLRQTFVTTSKTRQAKKSDNSVAGGDEGGVAAAVNIPDLEDLVTKAVEAAVWVLRNELSKSLQDLKDYVLGPLLFLLYVNDVGNSVPNIPVKLYVDDNNLFIYGKTTDILINDAQSGLTKLMKWFSDNKLSLSIDKTCLVHLEYLTVIKITWNWQLLMI